MDFVSGFYQDDSNDATYRFELNLLPIRAGIDQHMVEYLVHYFAYALQWKPNQTSNDINDNTQDDIGLIKLQQQQQQQLKQEQQKQAVGSRLSSPILEKQQAVKTVKSYMFESFTVSKVELLVDYRPLHFGEKNEIDYGIQIWDFV